MPGIAWGILVIWGALTGSALLGPPKAWDGVDPTSKSHFGKPAAVEYFTWSSSPRRTTNGDCEFTHFALVTRNKLTRLQINGEEQLVDWSWSWESKIPKGFQASGMMVKFIDPTTRKVLSTQEIRESCFVL